MFRSLHTSSSVVHINSTVSIQIIRVLLQCYSIVKNIFKNFYLTIFIAINTNITNKKFKTFYINYLPLYTVNYVVHNVNLKTPTNEIVRPVNKL